MSHDQLISYRKKISRLLKKLWPAINADSLKKSLFYKDNDGVSFVVEQDFPFNGREMLREWIENKEQEYIYAYQGVTIDPKTGVLFKNGRVIWGSTDYPARERTPKFFRHIYGNKTYCKKVILLHNLFDNNYYHFFGNVLPKFYLAILNQIDRDATFIVSEGLSKQKFYKELLLLNFFDGYNIIIQGKDEVIYAEECFVVKAKEFDIEAANWVRDKLNAPYVDDEASKAIYLNRGAKSANARFIRNQTELSAILTQYHVEFFDPQEHSLKEQINKIASAKLIISPHGAALTNMMFRKNPSCAVIEMLNPSLCAPHYFIMSKQRGFNYHPVLNLDETREKKASSIADLNAIELLLKKYL